MGDKVEHDLELVKRVANALHHAWECDEGISGRTCTTLPPQTGEEEYDCRERDARAAIEAVLSWQAEHADPEPRYSFENALQHVVRQILLDAYRRRPAPNTEEAFALIDCAVANLMQNITDFQAEVNADLAERNSVRKSRNITPS